ncbi:methyltransferase [bacterium]|nr:methyltransferase [bacterium]
MEDDLLPTPNSDPAELLRRRDGIYAADLLVCAAGELHFFDWLAGHPSRLPEICRGLALAERPADVMLALFASMGLVEREGERFRVTDLARDFLNDGSRFDLGPYFATMKERPACGEILEVLRTGKPTSWGSKPGGDEWTRAIEDADVARSFTAAMDGRGAYLAPPLATKLDLSGRASLLDIAGGSGIYACAIAAKHRGLKATVLEKPPVDAIARKAIDRCGMADRVSAASGDMFADLPEGHDVHLYSNVLHDWGEDAVRGLLRSSFDALPADGMVAIHDAHLNEEKTGPLPVAEYSVLLMCSTEGKCYSAGEIRAALEETGFTGVRLDPTVAWRSVVTATRPA